MSIQIISGLFLRFHYRSWPDQRFSSIVSIIQEVWGGWVIRLIHINGASLLFLFIYLHLFRGVYYSRSSNKIAWLSGILILFFIIGASFLGYVLPWGQISFWAVAVITNLISVIPIVGTSIVEWIWGGFSVGKPTLIRFFSLHFIMPFIILVLILAHLIYLHSQGSRNRIGSPRNIDKIRFHPYYTSKDIIFIILYLILIVATFLTFPFITLDPANNIPANPIVTPIHIAPEWYFLSSYSILRSIKTKASGVICLVISVLIYSINIMYTIKFSIKFSTTRNIIFWVTVSSFIILIYLGTKPAEGVYTSVGLYYSFIYFTSIILINL